MQRDLIGSVIPGVDEQRARPVLKAEDLRCGLWLRAAQRLRGVDAVVAERRQQAFADDIVADAANQLRGTAELPQRDGDVRRVASERKTDRRNVDPGAFRGKCTGHAACIRRHIDASLADADDFSGHFVTILIKRLGI